MTEIATRFGKGVGPMSDQTSTMRAAARLHPLVTFVPATELGGSTVTHIIRTALCSKIRAGVIYNADIGWVIAIPPGLSDEDEAEAIATGEHAVYRLETQSMPAPATGCHVATEASMAATLGWRQHAMPAAIAAAFLAPLTALAGLAAQMHQALAPALDILA